MKPPLEKVIAEGREALANIKARNIIWDWEHDYLGRVLDALEEYENGGGGQKIEFDLTVKMPKNIQNPGPEVQVLMGLMEKILKQNLKEDK